jgi:hypothetical protein
MTDYEQRLELAKKAYIATDGPGEAGKRMLWTLEQVGHSYTNMDVENLRVLFPSYMEKPSRIYNILSILGINLRRKDNAYVWGHITCLFIIPTIVIQIATKIKLRYSNDGNI